MRREQTRQDIDQILASLSSVETPPELEREVMAHLATIMREEQPRERTERRAMRWSQPRWFVLLPASSFAALVLLLSFHMSRPGSTKPTFKPVENTSVPKALLPKKSVPALQGQVSPSLRATAARPTLRRRARLTLALANVSYPAPPAPLTDEEKLLLHIAYKADPVQVASLDSLALEAKEQAAREDFQRFLNGRR